jgi:hypothetical protein
LQQPQSRPQPHGTPADAFTAIVAATCVMVILAPVLVWLFS